MPQIPIYCDIDTLEKILVHYTKCTQDALENDTLHENQHYLLIYNLIIKRAKLYLADDADIFLQKALKNPNLKKIFKNLKTDFISENTDFSTELPPNINPHSLFISNQSKEKCEELSQKYGFWFYNIEMLFEKTALLFATDLFNINKKKRLSNAFEQWADLKRYKHACNAMVIIDNYILEDTHEIEKNLFPMLDNLLPEKLENGEFDLTIFSANDRKLDNMHSFLFQKLQNFRSYIINLSVILITSDKNHDRHIFTNYLWLHSGYGFTYLNKKGEINKNTNLFLYSLFSNHFHENQNTTFDAICMHLEDMKQHSKTTESNQYQLKVCGNKQNRLFV